MAPSMLLPAGPLRQPLRGAFNPLDRFGRAAFLFDVPRAQYRNGPSSTGNFASLSGLTFTRASVGYAQTQAGVLQQFASGAPRITDKGLLIEGARTNKCTNYNAALPALVTPAVAATFNAAVTNCVASGDAACLFGVVDDTAALIAAGLDLAASNGRVFKIDNSAGSTNGIINVGGLTVNTNPHVFSAYMRATAGSINVGRSATSTGAVSVSGSAYSRAIAALTPAGSEALRIQVPAGGVAYFILNQLEEASFVSSPIVIAGASATRAADVATIAVSGISYPATLFAEFERVVDTGGAEGLLCAFGGAGEFSEIMISSTDVARQVVQNGGVSSVDQTAGSAYPLATTGRMAARVATNDSRLQGLSAGATDTSATLPKSPATILLGTRSGSGSPSFGFIKRAAIWSNLAFTDAQLQAVTA